LSGEILRADGIRVQSLTPHCGALISGLDLASGLNGDEVQRIRDELLRNKVIFFRDQALDPGSLESLASSFGDITGAHPTVKSKGVWVRSGYRSDHWHTDVTFIDRPAAISFLFAAEVPECGGDTLWANTASAYQAVPDPLRDLADRLRVVHEFRPDYDTQQRMAYSDEARARIAAASASTEFVTEHPMVRVHPETDERSLLLGSFARHIVGLSGTDSAALIQLFQSYVTKPENFVRWHWTAGDFAMWDNRASQHYATFDYGTLRRVMHRVTVAGDLPVGVDGVPSRALVGNSAEFVGE
jgi:alpha-ketoglutarate-dependent taurine dioxygenase